MLLSNLRLFFLLVIALAWLLTACGASPNAANDAARDLPRPKPRFPFEQHEPQAYQAEIVVTAGGVETKWFVARRGDTSRLDTGRGTPQERIEIRGPRCLTVIPGKMIYAELPPDGARGGLPGSLEAISRQYFAGAEYRRFAAAGTDGTLAKYIAAPDETSADSVTVWFDTAAGVITRQEVASADGSHRFTFELRGLKLDAEEQLFTPPAGARKVSAAEVERIYK